MIGIVVLCIRRAVLRSDVHGIASSTESVGMTDRYVIPLLPDAGAQLSGRALITYPSHHP